MAQMNRRQFVKLAALSGTAAVSAGLLGGCGSSRAESPSESGGASAAGPSTSASPAESESASSTASGSESAEGKADSLVLIFSRAGENYGVGTVEVGNTMVLAQMVAEKTGAALFEIERATPYPESYDACCDEALEEQRAGARPALKAMPDISAYKTVYFGFPCWWGDLPMPVYTAIEALDWNGKVICPFNTHAGSGESGMFSTLAAKCEGAAVMAGLTLSGEVAQNDRSAAESSVDSWLASLR